MGVPDCRGLARGATRSRFGRGRRDKQQFVKSLQSSNHRRKELRFERDLRPRMMSKAQTRRRYVGSCEDVDERVRRHNAGHSKSTRHGVPWTLIHRESFSTRAEAVRQEIYYKSGRGRDELDRLESAGAAATGRAFESRRAD